MAKLVIELEADVNEAEGGVLLKEGLNLGHDANGIYIHTAGKLARIYPVVKEAYINHDTPITLGGRHKK